MAIERLVEHFGAVVDPRCRGKVEHRLTDILVIAVCAVIACVESWNDIALYGRSKLAWLRTFLELPNGIPSLQPLDGHDLLPYSKEERSSPARQSTSDRLLCVGPVVGPWWGHAGKAVMVGRFRPPIIRNCSRFSRIPPMDWHSARIMRRLALVHGCG